MQFVQFTAARADTGAVLPRATATVVLTGTSTHVALTDASGTAIGNPVTASDNGLVGFAPVGDVTVDILIASEGGSYSPPPITGLQIVDLIALKAALTAEVSARTSGDSAEASRAGAAEGALLSAISAIQSALTGKASSSDLATLSSVVTGLQSALGGKASAADLATLIARVTMDEGLIASKAAASDVAALQGRMTTAETGISSDHASILNLLAFLNATTSHLSAIDARFTADEATAETLGDQVTDLEGQLTSKAALTTAVQREGRPGDVIERFVTTGSGVVATASDAGKVWRVTGTSVTTLRERVALDPARLYQFRWAVERSANPTDPAGSTVRLALQFYGADGSPVAQQVVQDVTLHVADGRLTATVTLGVASATGIAAWPAAARYASPYVETFDLDGVTDVQWIDWADETDVAGFSGQVTDLTNALGNEVERAEAAEEQEIVNRNSAIASAIQTLATAIEPEISLVDLKTSLLDMLADVTDLPGLMAAFMSAEGQAVLGFLADGTGLRLPFGEMRASPDLPGLLAALTSGDGRALFGLLGDGSGVRAPFGDLASVGDAPGLSAALTDAAGRLLLGLLADGAGLRLPFGDLERATDVPGLLAAMVSRDGRAPFGVLADGSGIRLPFGDLALCTDLPGLALGLFSGTGELLIGVLADGSGIRLPFGDVHLVGDAPDRSVTVRDRDGREQVGVSSAGFPMVGVDGSMGYLNALSGLVDGAEDVATAQSNWRIMQAALNATETGKGWDLRPGGRTAISQSLVIPSHARIGKRGHGINPTIFMPAACFTSTDLTGGNRYGANATALWMPPGTVDVELERFTIESATDVGRCVRGVSGQVINGLRIGEVGVVGIPCGASFSLSSVIGDSWLDLCYGGEGYDDYNWPGNRAQTTVFEIDQDVVGGVGSILRLRSPKAYSVDRLPGTGGAIFYGRNTDGINVCSQLTVLIVETPDISLVDEGIDNWGQITVVGGSLRDIYGRAIKTMHGATHSNYTGMQILRPAHAGIILFGSVGSDPPTGGISFANMTVSDVDPTGALLAANVTSACLNFDTSASAQPPSNVLVTGGLLDPGQNGRFNLLDQNPALPVDQQNHVDGTRFIRGARNGIDGGRINRLTNGSGTVRMAGDATIYTGSLT